VLFFLYTELAASMPDNLRKARAYLYVYMVVEAIVSRVADLKIMFEQ